MTTIASNTALTDPASIAANRAGQLTPWQRQSLPPPPLNRPLTALVVWSVVMLIGLYFFLGLPVTALLLNRPSDAPLISLPLSSNDLIVVGVIGGLFLFINGLFLALVTGGGILPATRSLRLKLRLRRDLSEGLIAQEDGQVIFARKNGYVARGIGGPLLGLDGGVAVGLPPGVYRFYYLPRTRRILSAERQALWEPGGPQARLLEALSVAHNFSLNELAKNQRGQMAFRQRFSLAFWTIFLYVLVLGLAVYLGVVVSPRAGSYSWGPLVGFLLLAALPLYFIYRRLQDWLDGRVAMLESIIEREEESDEGTTYYYVLGTQRFRVSSEAYAALVPGQRYRLYYLPHTKRILSIEPLP